MMTIETVNDHDAWMDDNGFLRTFGSSRVDGRRAEGCHGTEDRPLSFTTIISFYEFHKTIQTWPFHFCIIFHAPVLALNVMACIKRYIWTEIS